MAIVANGFCGKAPTTIGALLQSTPASVTWAGLKFEGVKPRPAGPASAPPLLLLLLPEPDALPLELDPRPLDPDPLPLLLDALPEPDEEDEPARPLDEPLLLAPPPDPLPLLVEDPRPPELEPLEPEVAPESSPDPES